MPKKKTTAIDRLPQKWEKLAAEHAKAGALLRSIVVQQLEALQAEIEAYPEQLEQWDGEHETKPEPPNVRSLRGLGETLVRAIDIERQAMHMDLQRDSTAIQRVQQLGFLVQRPNGAIEVDSTVIDVQGEEVP